MLRRDRIAFKDVLQAVLDSLIRPYLLRELFGPTIRRGDHLA